MNAMNDWDRFDFDLKRLFDEKRYGDGDSHRETMANLSSSHIRPPSPIPADPFSEEFRAYQMRLYERVSGRPYAPFSTELAQGLSFKDMLARPWPYQGADVATAGYYLIGVGQILRVLGARPAKRVLEYGPGWGHTTLAMARAGLEVTAVDVEQNFLNYIDHNARINGCSVTTFNGLFGQLPDPAAKFDAVVFFECFHHAFDHRAMIKQLRPNLNPGGRFILCNENISAASPYPWGLRMDAHSLTMVHNLGWMELGFTESYIFDLFQREGFTVYKHHIVETGEAALCYEAVLN